MVAILLHAKETTMGHWSTFDKLKYILASTLTAMVVAFGYSQWALIPERALLPGRSQQIDHTVEVLLQSRSRSDYYRDFSAADIDAVLAGAQLSPSKGAAVASVQLTGASGQVEWWNGRFDSHSAPGLHVRVRATVTQAGSGSAGEDIVSLRLPGLSMLGKTDNEDARVSWGSGSPQPGDSLIVQRIQHYPTLEAVAGAQQPYEILMALAGAVLLGIVACAIRKMVRTG
ncbi:MAG: hypothetical protein ABI451_04750 [Dokdonella sp.]